MVMGPINKEVYFSYFKPSGGAINSSSFLNAKYFSVSGSIASSNAGDILRGGKQMILGGLNGF
jgi:hypothetical protein